MSNIPHGAYVDSISFVTHGSPGITMDMTSKPRQGLMKTGSDKVHAPEMDLSKRANSINQEHFV